MAHLGESHKSSSHAGFALNPVSSFHSATSSGPSAGGPGGPSGPSRKKRWQAPRFSLLSRGSRSSNHHPHPHHSSNNGLHRNEQHQHEQQQQLSPEQTRTSNATAMTARSRWWRVRLFRGMINDIKRRAPFYWSDWRDAWDYRVVPATVYMYFAKYGLLEMIHSFPPPLD